jgi:hypothetical protein
MKAEKSTCSPGDKDKSGLFLNIFEHVEVKLKLCIRYPQKESELAPEILSIM